MDIINSTSLLSFSVDLSVHLSVHLSVCRLVCLSVCVFLNSFHIVGPIWLKLCVAFKKQF